MATFEVSDTYQPRSGDLRIQRVYSADLFSIHRYYGQRWQCVNRMRNHQIQEFVHFYIFLGEDESKGKKRQYYRKDHRQSVGQWVPQFSDGSGWNLEDGK